MDSSAPRKLIQTTVLLALALATSNILALPGPCNFSMWRNDEGNLTKIQVGDKLAIIEPGRYLGSWNAVVKNTENFYADVVQMDQTGIPRVRPFNSLPIEEIERLDNITNKRLTGLQIFSQDELVFIKSTNGNLMNVKATLYSNYTITGSRGTELLAINTVHMDSKYAHIFVQNQTIVTTVDIKCKDVNVAPMNKLDHDLQIVLHEAMM